MFTSSARRCGALAAACALAVVATSSFAPAPGHAADAGDGVIVADDFAGPDAVVHARRARTGQAWVTEGRDPANRPAAGSAPVTRGGRLTIDAPVAGYAAIDGPEAPRTVSIAFEWAAGTTAGSALALIVSGDRRDVPPAQSVGASSVHLTLTRTTWNVVAHTTQTVAGRPTTSTTAVANGKWTSPLPAGTRLLAAMARGDGDVVTLHLPDGSAVETRNGALAAQWGPRVVVAVTRPQQTVETDGQPFVTGIELDRAVKRPAAPRRAEPSDRYVARDGRAMPMNVFRARRPRAPVLVAVHQGGWRSGSPSQLDGVCRAVQAELDVACFSIAYRKDPTPAPLAEALDVVDAVTWIRSHASVWDVDPARVALYGASAGGNLALLAHTAHGLDVRAVVAASAVTDLERWPAQADVKYRAAANRVVSEAMGCGSGNAASGPNDACLAQKRDASPLRWASRHRAPVLLFHSADDFVPGTQARAFAAALPSSVAVRVGSAAGNVHPASDTAATVDWLATYL